MKKFLSLLMVVFTLGLGTVAINAEAAKRMGSGKSIGTQRQATPDKAPTTPAATAPAAGAAGAAAAPSRSWMGPVAGLAAGLGLAALASHLGLGDELASMVMMGLLAAAVIRVEFRRIAICCSRHKQCQHCPQRGQAGAGKVGLQSGYATGRSKHRIQYWIKHWIKRWIKHWCIHHRYRQRKPESRRF